jgi:hypothetical protein
LRLFRYCPLLWLAGAACTLCQAQAGLPDAPAPQADLVASAASEGNGAAPAATAGQETFPPQGPSRQGPALPALRSNYVPLPHPCRADSCSETAPARSCCQQDIGVFDEYLRQNALHIYTPRQLGGMAFRSVIDPFNLLTIGGTSAISVASDSHSPYGPGMKGFAKQSGVTLTEDIVGEFVGTFAIPSIDHQDPHYHRMPNASLRRRIAHCLYQPYWTVSDTGKGMVNYSNVVGAPLEEAVDSSYVPYRQVGWGAGADRVAINLATMPIGNFVTEFIPDVASHINFNVVFLQRIVDRVAIEEGSGAGAP